MNFEKVSFCAWIPSCRHEGCLIYPCFTAAASDCSITPLNNKRTTNSVRTFFVLIKKKSFSRYAR